MEQVVVLDPLHPVCPDRVIAAYPQPPRAHSGQPLLALLPPWTAYALAASVSKTESWGHGMDGARPKAALSTARFGSRLFQRWSLGAIVAPFSRGPTALAAAKGASPKADTRT